MKNPAPDVKARLLGSGNEVATSPSPEASDAGAPADGKPVGDRAEQAKVMLD